MCIGSPSPENWKTTSKIQHLLELIQRNSEALFQIERKECSNSKVTHHIENIKIRTFLSTTNSKKFLFSFGGETKRVEQHLDQHLHDLSISYLTEFKECLSRHRSFRKEYENIRIFDSALQQQEIDRDDDDDDHIFDDTNLDLNELLDISPEVRVFEYHDESDEKCFLHYQREKNQVLSNKVMCVCGKGFSGIKGVARCDECRSYFFDSCGLIIEENNEDNDLDFEMGSTKLCRECLKKKKCHICKNLLLEETMNEETNIESIIDYCAYAGCKNGLPWIHLSCASESKYESVYSDGKFCFCGKDCQHHFDEVNH